MISKNLLEDSMIFFYRKFMKYLHSEYSINKYSMKLHVWFMLEKTYFSSYYKFLHNYKLMNNIYVDFNYVERHMGFQSTDSMLVCT